MRDTTKDRKHSQKFQDVQEDDMFVPHGVDPSFFNPEKSRREKRFENKKRDRYNRDCD
jgi:hypothetical protein